MNTGAWVSIVVAVIGVVGVAYTAIKASKTTLARTNYENAEALYKQYQSVNAEIKEDFKNDRIRNEENTKRLEGEIKTLREELKNTTSQFKERETYLENEIEKREDRIDELEHKLNISEVANLNKDIIIAGHVKTIAQFERGNINGI